MPPAGSTVIDDLDRANAANDLGPGQPYAAAFGTVQLSLVGNAAGCQNNAYCASYRNDTTHGPNAYAGLQVGVLPSGDTFASHRASFRVTSPTVSGWSGYQLLVYQTRVALARMLAGADSELIDYAAEAPQAGDDYIAEKVGNICRLWRRRSGTWLQLGTDVTNTELTAVTGNLAWDSFDPGLAGRIAAFYGGTIASGTTFDRSGLIIVGP